MKKIYLLGMLATGAAAPFQRPSFIPAPGVWEASESTDALDGTHKVDRTLYSSNYPPNAVGDPSIGMLGMGCVSGEPVIYFTVVNGPYIATGSVPVGWRVDQKPIITEQWYSPQGNTTTVMATPEKTRTIMSAMRGGHKLVTRIYGTGGQEDIIFDLGDAATAIDALGCT